MHYVARVTIEKVTPPVKGQYANDAGTPRTVEEVFSSVVKGDDLAKLTDRMCNVVKAGLDDA